MKKEAKILLQKAIDSLILSVEHFNRPSDRGRPEAVLIFLDHAFEMLLKASILQQGGKIRNKKQEQTIGFDECVRRAISSSEINFLEEEQALVVQTINSLRDAAQHHYLDISEQLLYLQSQSGLSLFKTILENVFDDEKLVDLPSRVLPLSTTTPTDLVSLFDNEVEEIKKLLRPNSRHQIEAIAKLRSLAITDGALRGEKTQPSLEKLKKLAQEIKKGKSWSKIFAGVATINITANGFGPSIDLKITKKEGIPIQLVPIGTPNALVVGVKRVNELDFYNLGLRQLSDKLNLTSNKLGALIDYLGIKSDQECYRKIELGKSAKFNRYSQKTIIKIKDAIIKDENIVNKAWQKYSAERQRKIREWRQSKS